MATPIASNGRNSTNYRLLAVLHVGHDGQPEGRAVLAPLDGAACLRSLPARCLEFVGTRCGHAGRADVSCQCLEPALRVRPGWRKIVFPGAGLDGASVYELFEKEKVTLSAGVPTVWLGLLQHVKQNNLKFSTFSRTLIGGSACPPAMIRSFQDEYGVQRAARLGDDGNRAPWDGVHLEEQAPEQPDKEQQYAIQFKQGRPLYGVDMKIVDDAGKELPWDGKAFGDLLVRGPWITSEYLKGEGGNVMRDGWFPTGDVATIDADGFMQITDRSKDVIKSGGEWISSIDLENTAMAHPAVKEAAVVGRDAPEMGRTSAADGREETGRSTHARGVAPVFRRPRGEMVDTRRRGVRGRAAAYRHRQAAQDQAAGRVQESQAADGLTANSGRRSLEALWPTPGPTRRASRSWRTAGRCASSRTLRELRRAFPARRSSQRRQARQDLLNAEVAARKL